MTPAGILSCRHCFGIRQLDLIAMVLQGRRSFPVPCCMQDQTELKSKRLREDKETSFQILIRLDSEQELGFRSPIPQAIYLQMNLSCL